MRDKRSYHAADKKLFTIGWVKPGQYAFFCGLWWQSTSGQLFRALSGLSQSNAFQLLSPGGCLKKSYPFQGKPRSTELTHWRQFYHHNLSHPPAGTTHHPPMKRHHSWCFRKTSKIESTSLCCRSYSVLHVIAQKNEWSVFVE